MNYIDLVPDRNQLSWAYKTCHMWPSHEWRTIVPYIWIAANPRGFQRESWLNLFKLARGDGGMLLDNTDSHLLTGTITIYRGVSGQPRPGCRAGLSWTLDLDIARRFAYRFNILYGNARVSRLPGHCQHRGCSRLPDQPKRGRDRRRSQDAEGHHALRAPAEGGSWPVPRQRTTPPNGGVRRRLSPSRNTWRWSRAHRQVLRSDGTCPTMPSNLSDSWRATSERRPDAAGTSPRASRTALGGVIACSASAGLRSASYSRVARPNTCRFRRRD